MVKFQFFPFIGIGWEGPGSSAGMPGDTNTNAHAHAHAHVHVQAHA